MRRGGGEFHDWGAFAARCGVRPLLLALLERTKSYASVCIRVGGAMRKGAGATISGETAGVHASIATWT